MDYNQTAKRPCVHVESRNNDIRSSVNSRLAASGSKRWLSVFPAMISKINSTSFTDHRQPNSPNQLLRLSARAVKSMFFEHKKAKESKNQSIPHAKIKIEVGSWVRVALQTRNKGDVMVAKGPRQKWSSKSYVVESISKKEMYKLTGLPKRRFPFYSLQKIPGKRDYEGKDKVKKQITGVYKPSGGKADAKDGTKKNPFRNRRAAVIAGHKMGSGVYYNRGDAVSQL